MTLQDPILRATQESASGLLPSRIGKADDAIALMQDRVLERHRDPLAGADFSGSVRGLQQAFPGGMAVTPGRIAAELQASPHGDYADGAFMKAALGTTLGIALPFDEWMRRVRGLYDMSAVRRSRHRVVDGRLFLVGLAALDPTFADDLARDGVLEALREEADVLPVQDPEPAAQTTVQAAEGSASPADTQPDTQPAALPAGELAGGISSELVDPTKGISLDRDRLGVAPYVRMLASVICDRHTPVPLSVGIFGDWGSGKSYFMGMLRQRIDDIRTPPGDAYWHDIRQIGFNAWHYADSNLWASLGDEIFRQLLGSDENKDRQATLRAELERSNQQRQELEAAAKHAEREAGRLRAQVERASVDRDVRAKELLVAMKQSPAIQQRLAKVWRRLGVRDVVEQSRILAEQVSGAADEVLVVRRALADRRGKIAAALAIVALLVVAGTALLADDLRTLVRASATTLTAFLAAAVAAASVTQSGLKLLGTVIDEVQTGAASAATQRRDQQLGPLLQSLREAEAASDLAESQLANVVDRIGQLGQELAELAPGRRLYSFLAERVAAGDYSRNLGLISTIRKDFEQLIELMDDWRRRSDPNETARVPIDRIVLYIDDLDRCSTKQVVEVLQAVHLLLALELFIVVVGVDPRWLLRSLQQEYPKLLDSPRRAGAENDAWDASPEDYLEKIFGIPLILPGMNEGSLEEMLREVVADQERENELRAAVRPHEPDPASATAATDTSDGSEGSEDPDGSRGAGPTEITVDPGSQASDTPQEAAARPLEESEIGVLAALEPMIRTPREAKRLVNLYRMIRSTRDLSDKSRFMGDGGKPGDYQAVALLLGLLSAPGSLLGDVLEAPPDRKAKVKGGLTHRTAGSWKGFVMGMKPRENKESGIWSNDFSAELSSADRADWVRLATALERTTSLITLGGLGELQDWAPRIRRFSFVMSPSTDQDDA